MKKQIHKLNTGTTQVLNICWICFSYFTNNHNIFKEVTQWR